MNRHIREFIEKEGYHVISQEVLESKLDDLNDLQSDVSGEESKDGSTVTQMAEKVPDKGKASSAFGAADYDIQTISETLKWHMNRISENVIGRDEIIRQAFYSILTGEHMLLLSRTGMAKSYLTNYIFNTFEGARVFASQASKDQTPDNYFGPYNIEEFKKGRIIHNINGSIIEANLVFLDEFFDASDVVLRSLLSVLNERKFINGSEQIETAVHTAIATANYMRMNEVTEAVLDRFTYKAIIPEDRNVYSQLLIDHTYAFSMGDPAEPEKKIPFDQILYLTDIVKNKNDKVKVEIPDLVYFMKNVVVDKFVGEMRKSDYNFFISPRKQAKLGDFLRAQALINNRYTAEVDDLKELFLALCTLNSFISVKAKDKEEKDVYSDAFQQILIHFNTTGAMQQIEFLLNVRKIFQEIRENPEKRDLILNKKGLLESLKSLLLKIFQGRNRNVEDEPITIEVLRKSILDLNPAVEEVNELKEGIMRDYKDIY